jgi:hypothetical protein
MVNFLFHHNFAGVISISLMSDCLLLFVSKNSQSLRTEGELSCQGNVGNLILSKTTLENIRTQTDMSDYKI